MMTLRARTLVLGFVVALSRLASAAPADLTLDQYKVKLDQLVQATSQSDLPPSAISELRAGLPEVWRVHTGQATFDVSTAWLRDDLEQLAQSSSQERLQPIHDRLAGMRGELAAYEKEPEDFSSEHARITEILNRLEFQDAHGPTWIDRLKQRLIFFLFRLLGRAITASVFSNIGKFVVYGLMTLAVLGVGYWVYRSIRAAAKIETILPEALPVSAREWSLWLADARNAAQRGNWRDAIHLAYWAGISFLESQGAWRPDAARTPREYLRLISSANERRPVLASLTGKFEMVWYAGQTADAQAFQETLADLEKLGCR
jgi:Domain of unknown function (DUF4129)